MVKYKLTEKELQGHIGPGKKFLEALLVGKSVSFYIYRQCKEFNSHLANVNNQEEMEFLATHIAEDGAGFDIIHESWWTSGRRGEDGVFAFQDGTSKYFGSVEFID